MHNHSDGGSDLVVSLDAFKVSKQVDHTPGKIVTWELCPLTTWAGEMIKGAPRPIERGVPIGYGTRVIFDTRSDALAFLRELESELSWFARIEPTPPAVAATPSVFVATMDTTNFSFVAVGADEASAVAAMVGVMRAHRAQYGSDTWHPGYYAGTFDQFGDEYPTDGAAESEWLTWIAIEWYGVAVVELEMGHGARDGEAT